jgi:hypothetical protein
MSTRTDPGFIFSTAAAVTSTGGLRPGTGCQLTRVATRPGRVDRRLELHELGAEALSLLARLGPDVIRFHDRAESLGGSDGLEAGHTDAEDQHVGGLGRAGRRGQQREVAAVRIGGKEDRLVAPDVGLAAERVHRLCAGQGPRDRVEADRRHALAGEVLC